MHTQSDRVLDGLDWGGEGFEDAVHNGAYDVIYRDGGLYDLWADVKSETGNAAYVATESVIMTLRGMFEPGDISCLAEAADWRDR